jgi:peptidoglycan/xylan/chitin deacetylase (PgdA/CDA1 family)
MTVKKSFPGSINTGIRPAKTSRDLYITSIVINLGLFIIGLTVALLFSLKFFNLKSQTDPVSALIRSDFIKPTATPTPTPAQVIPAGYCLKVPVIFYHHIQPMNLAVSEGHGGLTVDAEMFDSQMKYLNDRGYRSISAEELVNALRGKTGLSGNPVVVTIDDGYADNFTYAYQTAKKYRIILNLMIPTGLVENPGYLTWDNLREMTGSGLVYAYDHTWSHFSMPGGDKSKEETEIMTAKKQLEEHLGKPVTIFSYPYGASNSQSVALLAQNGFTGAFTTIPSFYQCDSIIYGLHRNRIGNSPLSNFGL